MQDNYLELVGSLVDELEEKGFSPVLVGGMALIVLGSQRVTYDFDFLVSLQDLLVEEVMEIFYRHGFELISKFNERREVLRTIENARIASIRLKIDEPTSAYFYNHKNELKIDLLFDFPFPAKEVASRSKKINVKNHSLRVASREDLLRLKEIAYADRKLASDAQDLEFLRSIIKKTKK